MSKNVTTLCLWMACCALEICGAPKVTSCSPKGAPFNCASGSDFVEYQRFTDHHANACCTLFVPNTDQEKAVRELTHAIMYPTAPVGWAHPPKTIWQMSNAPIDFQRHFVRQIRGIFNELSGSDVVKGWHCYFPGQGVLCVHFTLVQKDVQHKNANNEIQDLQKFINNHEVGATIYKFHYMSAVKASYYHNGSEYGCYPCDGPKNSSVDKFTLFEALYKDCGINAPVVFGKCNAVISTGNKHLQIAHERSSGLPYWHGAHSVVRHWPVVGETPSFRCAFHILMFPTRGSAAIQFDEFKTEDRDSQNNFLKEVRILIERMQREKRGMGCCIGTRGIQFTTQHKPLVKWRDQWAAFQFDVASIDAASYSTKPIEIELGSIIDNTMTLSFQPSVNEVSLLEHICGTVDGHKADVWIAKDERAYHRLLAQYDAINASPNNRRFSPFYKEPSKYYATLLLYKSHLALCVVKYDGEYGLYCSRIVKSTQQPATQIVLPRPSLRETLHRCCHSFFLRTR